jgi:N-acetylglucosamine-6-sulfatase
MSSATDTRAAAARASRTVRLAVVVVAVVVVAAAVVLTTRPWSRERRPNIVLIVTDDQRWDTLNSMPAVRRHLVRGGVTFRNAFTTTPSCCPSRVGLLAGQYSHDSGVLDGSAGNAPGGAPAFSDGSSLATWLDQGGYRTGLFGKYLNDYAAMPTGYIPPGWNAWSTMAQSRPQVRYYDYDLNEDGEIVHYGDAPSDYSTAVLQRQAIGFVDGDAPFFLYFAPIAPHPPSVPAPDDVTAAVSPWVIPPSFNEANIRDKPDADTEPLDVAKVRAVRANMLRSLIAVDRAVEAIVDAVDAAGLSNDTYFILTSDNGYLWGEHRRLGKVWPYEESIRVPLVIRPPGRHPTRTVDAFALNLDVPATIAELAGVDPRSPQGGVSLVPLLDGGSGATRDRFVVEFLGYAPGIPAYSGIRTHRYLYVEYENGWKELYDVRADPFQLRNLAAGSGASSELIDRLSFSMRRIVDD